MHTSKEMNMKTKMMRENNDQIIFIHLPHSPPKVEAVLLRNNVFTDSAHSQGHPQPSLQPYFLFV
jgi:hypothetical protein